MDIKDQWYIIDRIEGDYYLIETPTESIIKVHKNYIEGNPKEGEVLVKKENKYIVDPLETNKRKAKIDELMKGMWADE